MNSPFDQLPPDAPVVNLMQQSQEHSTNTVDEIERRIQETATDMNSEPTVGGGNGKKKLLSLVIGVVALLVLGAVAMMFLSSDESAPEALPAPMEVPLAPVATPADADASVNGGAPVAPVAAPAEVTAPVAPASDIAVPTGPLQDAAPAVAVVHPCEQRMIDYATQNGADPKAYVAQNQAYLAECKKAMEAGAK